jgi:glutamine amidotransferase
MGRSRFAIIDYGMGNIQSIRNGLDVVGQPADVVSEPSELDDPTGIIVPGVGAFPDGMRNLQSQGFVEPLERLVVEEDVPYLGLCLGMQFLAERSHENGGYDGLGWISGDVTRIDSGDSSVRIPHMGWNEVRFTDHNRSVLFREFDGTGTFYFVHSYHLSADTRDEAVVTAAATHGTEITAAVRKDNIFGVQFHPEKSQGSGLAVIQNFVTYANGGEELSSKTDS